MLPDRGQELAAFQQRATEAIQLHRARLEQVPIIARSVA